MSPEPYAPYPLNRLRDWLHRRRNGVRLFVLIVASVWLGPPIYRLWNIPNPPGGPDFRFGMNLDPGLNIPPPEVDRSKELMAAINSLPTQPSAGPGATTAPSGSTWVPWREYEQIQGISPGPSSCSSPSGPTFSFDPGEALSGPWLDARFHLGEIVTYLEHESTVAALQTISDLSGQPHCLSNSKVNPALNLASFRQAVKLFTARARYRLEGKHDYPAAAEDIETVWRLAGECQNDGLLIPLFVGISCRCLALSEITNWCNEGLLTRAQAEDLLRRMDRYGFDAKAAVQVARIGERRLSLAYLDTLYAPGEHASYVLRRASNEYGNWLLRSMNLLSPLLYDRAQARQWILAVSSLDDGREALPHKPSPGELLMARITQDPLFPIARMYMYTGREAIICMRVEAEEEAARTALAVVMFKADHGHYPAELDELAPTYLPALRPDPFSGQPLRYRVERDGCFTLYSVGEDRQDNGGILHYIRSDAVFTSKRSSPTEEWVMVREADVKPGQPLSSPGYTGPGMLRNR